MNLQKKYLLIPATGLLLALNSTVLAATNFDVNGDGVEGLAESIHALQVVAGGGPASGSFTNSKSMTFNLIPAGTFTMGSPDGSGAEPAEPGRTIWEVQHQVTISKSFYIQTTEVTNKQWDDLMLSPKPTITYTGPNYPVQNVTWYTAATFANFLSSNESLTQCYNIVDPCNTQPGHGLVCSGVSLNPDCTGYRLPTEAEWEYAARATTTTAYPYAMEYDEFVPDGGVDPDFNSHLSSMGWYYWNDNLGGYPSGPKPVARKQANKWGLYDMNGNVHEFCQDWYGYNYYNTDPASGVDPLGPGPAPDSGKVLRGGSISSDAIHARSANRNACALDYRDWTTGFRLVRPVNQ